MRLHADNLGTSDAIAIALAGMWILALATFVATNIFLLLALPHTTLPAPMKIRYTYTSKELNAWRVALVLLLFLDIIYLAISIGMGTIMGVIAAMVYMYVLFSLHAGKIAWKENRLAKE